MGQLSWTFSYSADSSINCIGFATPTKGWALGQSYYGGGRAWRWNGSEWKQDERWDDARGSIKFYDVAFNGNYGWAVGNVTWHWDGSIWTEYDQPPTKDYKGYNAICVFILNEDDVWLGGDGYNVIARFKGFGR